MSWKGQLSRHLRGVRILASPTAAKSAAAREFWINNYDTIRMLNPRFPFILRDIPDENVEPYMIVKMDEAELSVHELGGLSVQEIEAKLQESFTKAEAIPKSGSFQMYELKYITE